MEQKEIFERLGQVALKSVEKINGWVKAILYIERQEKSVGFKSFYINEEHKEVQVDTEADYLTSKAVQNLYQITANHPLAHKRWNKAKFTVTPDLNFDIEYLWDQNWQDEVDGFNSSK